MAIPLGYVRNKIAGIVSSSSAGYRFLLGRRGYRRPVRRPPSTDWNAVLQTARDWKQAITSIRSLGLPLHPDGPKNWDSLIAMDAVLQNTTPTARVLDAGAALYSSLLPSLSLYGYRNLYGINLSFKRPAKLKLKRWPIHYLYSDLTNTAFPDESFDAVTCLSVIEHGVDVKAYFKEASRILKPGGLLITSADYWKEGVDASELTAHGTLAKVFAASEIMELLSLAHASRLELTAPLDFECQEKCVTWERLGLQFTFIIFTHRKT